MRKVDDRYLDREVALLVYNNKLYEDINHQYALEQALNDHGDTLGVNVDDNINELADKTYSMSVDNEIGTYGLYVGDYSYVVAHTYENLVNHFDIIESYANSEDAYIGYYSDFRSDEFVILDEIQEFEEMRQLNIKYKS